MVKFIMRMEFNCPKCGKTTFTNDDEIVGEILDGARDGTDEYGDYILCKCDYCGDEVKYHM